MTSTDLHDCFVYVDCDIPAGMTVAEWRRERDAAAAHRRRLSLRQLLRFGH